MAGNEMPLTVNFLPFSCIIHTINALLLCQTFGCDAILFRHTNPKTRYRPQASHRPLAASSLSNKPSPARIVQAIALEQAITRRHQAGHRPLTAFKPSIARSHCLTCHHGKDKEDADMDEQSTQQSTTEVEYLVSIFTFTQAAVEG